MKHRQPTYGLRLYCIINIHIFEFPKSTVLGYFPSLVGIAHPEPVILNVYGAPELIPIHSAGRYDNPIPPWFLVPMDFLKIPALCPHLSQESIPALLKRVYNSGSV